MKKRHAPQPVFPVHYCSFAALFSSSKIAPRSSAPNNWRLYRSYRSQPFSRINCRLSVRTVSSVTNTTISCPEPNAFSIKSNAYSNACAAASCKPLRCSGNAAKGESNNGEAPKPVDNPDNSIDDGQTSDNSFLYDASIADLAGADSYYDKQTVQVTGEVVGEAIAVTGDADHAWIVLRDSDTGSTVTVFVRRSDLRKIDTYGIYGTTGTTLRVRGMFNLACSQHEGESDVHAQVVNVVSAGYEHKDVFNVEDFAPGVVALAVGIVLALVFWRMRERSR